MFKTIIEASENFCVHQIREPYSINDITTKKSMLIAYIDINLHSGEKCRVYIASDTNFMQRVANVFLEELQSDEETLVDMTLETANLIVGSAKVIAEEANENPYTIGTPNFVKLDIFDLEYDQIKTITILDDTLLVAIKELDV